jgi:hypothetical protein
MYQIYIPLQHRSRVVDDRVHMLNFVGHYSVRSRERQEQSRWWCPLEEWDIRLVCINALHHVHLLSAW